MNIDQLLKEYEVSNTINNIKNINDKNINCFKKLITPNELFEILPNTAENIKFVDTQRREISNIIHKKDKRKLIIVGPCSIHNVAEAKEYALYLSELAKKVEKKIKIVMRVYFEKPRTINGWKGLINDPDLNKTYDIDKGLYLARDLLLYLISIKMPTAYEVLDTFTPQYISDLICWSAIGARTTESQVHRQLVSGLSMPTGFKNNTNGDCKIAIDAIMSANTPHYFYGITYDGKAARISTTGNLDCHLILRGSKNGPNYYIDDIKNIQYIMDENKLDSSIMIDCSHDNSRKDYKNQHIVWNYYLENYISNKNIIGLMLESNLNEGKQTLTDNIDALQYGVSITDSCIDFTETNNLILNMYNIL